ncbi:Transmembrane protein [Gossypium arboreum]|uniref:Transmembrane protein n=1 Tax=Gossypium arboreum TaxID=29729 RepID=A0A0B0N4F9_GOSAR|nr:Transmembrane protein [Gossypium arboreum]KHG27036.1 Transmembrane protein [Gossypium arboreum]KHG28193.1 Transmembrane protein [Gossypium arboreum]
MYCQFNKTFPQLDLIENIFFFQSICLILIRLKTCLGSSTHIHCLFILRSDHIISFSIRLNIRQPVNNIYFYFTLCAKTT